MNQTLFKRALRPNCKTPFQATVCRQNTPNLGKQFHQNTILVREELGSDAPVPKQNFRRAILDRAAERREELPWLVIGGAAEVCSSKGGSLQLWRNNNRITFVSRRAMALSKSLSIFLHNGVR